MLWGFHDRVLSQTRVAPGCDSGLRQYFADRRIRNLSPGTLRIYDKILQYFGEFLLREQPGSQLLMSHLTPERAKGYVAHRMRL